MSTISTSLQTARNCSASFYSRSIAPLEDRIIRVCLPCFESMRAIKRHLLDLKDRYILELLWEDLVAWQDPPPPLLRIFLYPSHLFIRIILQKALSIEPRNQFRDIIEASNQISVEDRADVLRKTDSLMLNIQQHNTREEIPSLLTRNRAAIIQAISAVPRERRESVIVQTLTLVSPHLTQLAPIIHRIAAIPEEEEEEICSIVWNIIRLSNHNNPDPLINALIDAISHFSREERERIVQLIDAIVSSRSSNGTLQDIGYPLHLIQSFNGIPPEIRANELNRHENAISRIFGIDRASVLAYAEQVSMPSMMGQHAIIPIIARIPLEAREATIQSALRYINHPSSQAQEEGRHPWLVNLRRASIINAISQIPTEAREAVIESSLTCLSQPSLSRVVIGESDALFNACLFLHRPDPHPFDAASNEMERSGRMGVVDMLGCYRQRDAQIISAIAQVPPTEREGVITYACQLISPHLSSVGQIITEVNSTPLEERNEIINRAIDIILSSNRNNQDWMIVCLIDTIQNIPLAERANLLSSVESLLHQVGYNSAIEDVLARLPMIRALARLDADLRNSVVREIRNLIHQGHNCNNLFFLINTLAILLRADPTHPLVQAFTAIPEEEREEIIGYVTEISSAGRQGELHHALIPYIRGLPVDQRRSLIQQGVRFFTGDYSASAAIWISFLDIMQRIVIEEREEILRLASEVITPYMRYEDRWLVIEDIAAAPREARDACVTTLRSRIRRAMRFDLLTQPMPAP